MQSRGPASNSIRMSAGAASSEQAQSTEKLSDATKTDVKCVASLCGVVQQEGCCGALTRSYGHVCRTDQPQQQLQLNTGGFIIPHPQKVAKGGEDAFYIATNQRSFGVADGVGGWVCASHPHCCI